MKKAAMSSKGSLIEVIGANEDPMIAGPVGKADVVGHYGA
jgi:hypothetical protein